MKFIHTADIHLDSPLRGLAAYPDAPAERLRTATRDAFRNLVSRAIEEEVNFVIISGDLYDGDWKDFNTGLFFVGQMGRLRQAGIPVYLLYGNHDAESEMTKGLQLPDNVHKFSSRQAETFRIDALKVALHGRSFRVAATTDNLLPSYPHAIPGWFNIGVLHTALEGNSEHAKYAPCSVGELQAKGYRYWALGHVHEYWVQLGETTIAYPGNIQGRHIRECGPRGALLITAEAEEITDIERIEVDVLRWHAIEVDITGSKTLGDAARLAGQHLEMLLQSIAGNRPMAVRVTFTGQSNAHRDLLGQESQLRQEVIAQAVTLCPDRIWIEKIKIASKSPSDSSSAIIDAELAESLMEIENLAKTAVSDSDFIKSLHEDIQILQQKLRHEVLQSMPELKEFLQNPATLLPGQIEQTVAVLVAKLQESPVALAGRES